MASTIEHRTVTVNDVSFHVAIATPSGSDEPDAPVPRGPVVCLHGFPEGWQSWRPMMRELPDIAFYAPDLRGYPISDYPRDGYDVFTLTDDIRLLLDELGLDNPTLMTHDWGGFLGWIFAHRFPDRLSRLAVVNCPHPRTLVRAVLKFEDFQTLRIPWVPAFLIPWLPEALLTTGPGRKLLELSFTLREGSQGDMDTDLVREIVHRYQHAEDLRGAINYYRQFVSTMLNKESRARLGAIFDNPITVPVTQIWGKDCLALSSRVARRSDRDAGCPVEWRPLEGIGHFVELEAPELLAAELDRLLRSGRSPVRRKKARRTTAA